MNSVTGFSEAFPIHDNVGFTCQHSCVWGAAVVVAYLGIKMGLQEQALSHRLLSQRFRLFQLFQRIFSNPVCFTLLYLWWLLCKSMQNKPFYFTYKRPVASHMLLVHVESWQSYQIYRRPPQAKCAVSRCRTKAFTTHSQTVKHCSFSEEIKKAVYVWEEGGLIWATHIEASVARNKGSRTNGCPF